ncbi:MAG: S41 family peptidase [Saprospiraceae bacterium]|nr:S41 family peptidase [Saprospiraceae bacterium]
MSENKEQNTLAVKATKREIWLPLFLSLAMIGGVLVGMKLKNEPLIKASPKKNVSQSGAEEIIGQGRMEEILRYVDAKYVDKVSNDFLVDKAINNILQELDPHSVYIPSSEISKVNEELDGEYDGIGIETMNFGDTITVVTPLADGPASKAGLMSGDRILAIGDSMAIGKDQRWLNYKLRGKRGSNLKFTILRIGENRPKSIVLQRDKVPVNSVDGATTLDDNTGYVKISRFSSTTSREFMAALEYLYDKKGVKNLVIDLRGNPGGYLDKAVDILSQLFPEKDKLLVLTKGRTVHQNEYKTSGRQRYKVDKVAILTDEGSASASEIVAGAVQDWDRGVIIGRRTFGKGLVQEPYELYDGSELRLTVARYYTPIGRSIQKPYRGKTRQEYDDEYEKRFGKGELTIQDSIYTADTVRFRTAGGRWVYGGGGIIPDVFIPIESYMRNEYYQNAKSWASEYAFQYYVGHRKELKFNTWQEFQRNFKVSDYSFSEFLKYAERHNVRSIWNQIIAVKEPLRRQIKARIARQLFGDEGYYGIMNESDPCIQNALYQFQKEDPLGLRRIAQRRN